MARVAIIVLNDVKTDSRVQKIAESLASFGHTVRVFAQSSDRFAATHDPQKADFADERVDVIYLPHRFAIRSEFYERFMTFFRHLLFGVGVVFSPIKFLVGILRFHKWGFVPLPMLKNFRRGKAQVSRFSWIARLIGEYFSGYWGKLLRFGRRFRRQARAALRLMFRIVRGAVLLPFRIFAREFSVIRPPRDWTALWVEHIQSWSPDIVHLCDLETARIGLLLSRDNSRLKLVYDSHEWWSGRTRAMQVTELFFARFERDLESKLVKEANAVLTVSGGLENLFRQTYPGVEEKLYLVKNSPSFESGHFEHVPPSPTQNPAPLRIVYPGRVAPGRLLEELIAAAGRQSNSEQTWTISLLGYGPPRYVKHLLTLGARANVDLSLLEPVPSKEVVRTLSTFDLVFVGVKPVSVSYQNSLPNKFLEGLASGRPVVFSALHEMVKVAERFPSTFAFNPASVDSLTEAMVSAARCYVGLEEIEARRSTINWANEAEVLKVAYSSAVESR